MPQRNNPMSAVQKKRTVSTTKKKGTTSSSKTSRTSKKEQMKHRTVMPVWIRNILAVVIIGCFSVVFYYFFIRPYAYRWKPCHGLKEYGVCIPDGYDIHGIDISHYQGKIDWKRPVSYTHLDVYKRQVLHAVSKPKEVSIISFFKSPSIVFGQPITCTPYFLAA